MAVELKWTPELFENSYAGVNSAVTPELIQLDQLAWGINVSNRGAKPGTRPPFKLRMILPSGLVQGSGYFSAQNGMGVAAIAGRIYRIRIQGNNFSYEQIPLGFLNSPTVKQVWMQQTVETLVIQDGQSDAILYNGGTARRAAAHEVPRGRMMAYGNGRLWVAINDKELVAGDIRTRVAGSELFFTETDYLSGGGSLYFSEGITGLAFIPTTGSSDYGALMVYGPQQARSVRADITNRDLWAQYPGFVTNILDETGCAGDWSIVEVNQDLYWRDNSGGFRSIRSSLADESGPGNSPISREVRRITDFETTSLLKYSSGINFNNRLLMLASPFLNVNGGISWKNIVPLDFAPVSTMRGKSEPSYDGQWDGLSAVSMFSGEINRKPRAFVISTEADGSNALWEIMPDNSGEIADVSEDCSSVPTTVPIQCAIEHGRRNFGDAKKLKRLRRCDVYLYDIEDDVDLKVYWRTDNAQKWRQWDGGVEVCAQMTDPSEADPHVWKNLAPQQRPQLKTFTIPQGIDDITHYGINTGYEFQIRLVWEGKCRIYKTVLWATALDQPAYALRDLVTEDCLDNDITEEVQQLEYTIPIHDCRTIVLGPDTLEGSFASLGLEGMCDWEVVSVPEGVDPDAVTVSDGTGCGQSFTLPAYGIYTFQTTNPEGGEPIIVRVQAEALFTYEAYCRRRSGGCEICGFDEFSNPSSPPKKYLQIQYSGSIHADVYTGLSCEGAVTGTLDLSWAGTSLIDWSTCEQVSNGISSLSVDGGLPVDSPLLGKPSGYVPSCFDDIDDERTSFVVTATGDCCQSGPNNTQIHVGTLTATLSDENTPDACIGHLYPDIEDGWSEWRVPASVFCAQPECCLAFKSEVDPVTDEFSFQQAQFRIKGWGFDPSTGYKVSVQFWRRVHVDEGEPDPFVLFETSDYALEVATDGTVDFHDFVPNEIGFDTVALAFAVSRSA